MAFRHEKYADPAKQLERLQLSKIRQQYKCIACTHCDAEKKELPCKKGKRWPARGYCQLWQLADGWKPIGKI